MVFNLHYEINELLTCYDDKYKKTLRLNIEFLYGDLYTRCVKFGSQGNCNIKIIII